MLNGKETVLSLLLKTVKVRDLAQPAFAIIIVYYLLLPFVIVIYYHLVLSLTVLVASVSLAVDL
jgi:hypothetical protein